jgi:hypothetical protein
MFRLTLLLFVSLLLFGCYTSDLSSLEPEMKNHPRIKTFFDEHSEVTVEIFMNNKQSRHVVISDFYRRCPGLGLHEKINIKLEEGSDILLAWYDPEEKKIVCAYSPSDCLEVWSCSYWAPHVCPKNGQKTRSCDDYNSCGTTVSKPPELQYC